MVATVFISFVVTRVALSEPSLVDGAQLVVLARVFSSSAEKPGRCLISDRPSIRVYWWRLEAFSVVVEP